MICQLIADGSHYNMRIHPGLQFTKDKREFTFTEVPGLKEAGWTETMYLDAASNDNENFAQQCTEVV